MQILLLSRQITNDGLVRDHVMRRLRLSLARFGSRVVRAHVRILDLNGPRGGADKCCRVEIRLRGAHGVFVEDTDPDLGSAVDSVADRARRAVARAIERSRGRRRSISPGREPDFGAQTEPLGEPSVPVETIPDQRKEAVR
jgi:putative sigma-54 modulation protein